jgi:23S rRNA (guanosine2251-2'-O)-methyltransferase
MESRSLPMDDEYIIWGRRPVMEALESGREFNKIFVARGAVDGRMLAAARERRIPVVEMGRSALDRMTADEQGVAPVHQGVVAHLSPILYAELDDLVETAKARGEDLFVAVLDGISDPQNLGSIIRTANAAGAHGVVIPTRRSSQVSPIVVKASAGAVAHTPVARVGNIAQTIERLKQSGVWVVGAASDADKRFYDADFTGPIAVVVGSEGKGMSRLVGELVDFTVSIPMAGDVSSLNAGVAWAVIAFEIARQRSIQAGS